MPSDEIADDLNVSTDEITALLTAMLGSLQLAGGSSSITRRRKITGSVALIVQEDLVLNDHTAWKRPQHLLRHRSYS